MPVVWTLPFGFLVMMAVFNRFDGSLEEAARDMGASELDGGPPAALLTLAPYVCIVLVRRSQS